MNLSHHRYWIAALIAAVLYSGCAAPGYTKSEDQLRKIREDEAAAPPPPPPQKKPEIVWTCRISNGAGRIFNGKGDSPFIAQMHGKQECERAARNCFILGCSAGPAN